MYELTEEIKLEKNYKHTIEIVVDRLSVKPEIRSVQVERVEKAFYDNAFCPEEHRAAYEDDQ